MTNVRIVRGDSIEVLRELPEGSVDAVVCDPPYGLEFMGKSWDSFRPDESRVSSRWAGDRAGAQGSLKPMSGLPAQIATPAYGGQRPTTSRCTGCGRRDAFRNPHACPEGTAWKVEPVTPNAAPPAMLAFQAWTCAWATEAYRVLKPGGHLLAFGGTRTYHRLAAGLEDAGFEVRDTLAWLYGSGFPKSHDVSKALDKAAGADRPDREVAEPAGNKVFQPTQTVVNKGTPVTDEAKRWEGWGTALKPAHEPIVVARKPLEGTVAGNVLTHGTGAIHVDACRVGTEVRVNPPAHNEGGSGWGMRPNLPPSEVEGRWPTNVLLACTCAEVIPGDPGTVEVVPEADRVEREQRSTNFAMARGFEHIVRKGEVPEVHTDPDCPAALLDDQTGYQKDGVAVKRNLDPDRPHDPVAYDVPHRPRPDVGYGGTGGASRYFLRVPLDDPEYDGPRVHYSAKASKKEREAGLDDLPPGNLHRTNAGGYEADPKWAPVERKNVHPTVKPVGLMRWLVRLVTPPGGTVLDPFLGSGSTGIAAALEGFDFVGVEMDATYAEIAARRVAHWAPDALVDLDLRPVEAAEEAA